MIQGWNLTRALRNGGCREVDFDRAHNSNSRGYTIFKDIALNPDITERNFVGVHELAHATLNHSEATDQDIIRLLGDEKKRYQDGLLSSLKMFLHEEELDLAKNLHEVEAHSIALLCASVLEFGPDDYDELEEQKYLGHYMTEVAEGGTDPVAHIENNKDRLLQATKDIVVNGFINPKRGRDVVLQALRR